MSLVRSYTADGLSALLASKRIDDSLLFGTLANTAENKANVASNGLTIAQNHTDVSTIQANLAANVSDITIGLNVTSCTSTTRPVSNLVLGRRIYETDTGASGFWNGTEWIMIDSRFQPYNPIWTAPPGGPPVLGAGGWIMGRYARVGKRTEVVVDINLGTTGAYGGASGNAWTVSLPIPTIGGQGVSEPTYVGAAWVSPNGTTQFPGFVDMISTTTIAFLASANASGAAMARVAGAYPVGGVAITFNARVRAFLTYPAA